MSSPPKKIRKSGSATVTLQNESTRSPTNEMPMEEDLDPASLYEDEEGNITNSKITPDS